MWGQIVAKKGMIECWIECQYALKEAASYDGVKHTQSAPAVGLRNICGGNIMMDITFRKTVEKLWPFQEKWRLGITLVWLGGLYSLWAFMSEQSHAIASCFSLSLSLEMAWSWWTSCLHAQSYEKLKVRQHGLSISRMLIWAQGNLMHWPWVWWLGTDWDSLGMMLCTCHQEALGPPEVETWDWKASITHQKQAPRDWIWQWWSQRTHHHIQSPSELCTPSPLQVLLICHAQFQELWSHWRRKQNFEST
jgi:hypothetical protein